MLAGNVANLDTPGYRPIDLERRTAGDPAELAVTHEGHIAAPATSDVVTSFDDGAPQRSDGNAVSLERELPKIDASRARYATSASWCRAGSRCCVTPLEMHLMSTMDFFTAMKVSASGLSAERTRMNVAASNLANAQTTQAARRWTVQAPRRDAAVGGRPRGERHAVRPGGQERRGLPDRAGRRAAAAGVRPGHPQANAQGYVAYPDVNPVEEMVDMMHETLEAALDAATTALATAHTIHDLDRVADHTGAYRLSLADAMQRHADAAEATEIAASRLRERTRQLRTAERRVDRVERQRARRESRAEQRRSDDLTGRRRPCE